MSEAVSNAFKVVEHVGTQMGLTGRKDSVMQREAKKKAREKAERARVKARKRLKPLPDIKAEKLAARKATARRAATRKGRSSTILSRNETLG